jgi:hypothetical protein
MMGIFLLCWLPSGILTLLIDLDMLEKLSNSTRKALSYSSYFDDLFYGIISFLFWFVIPNLRKGILDTIYLIWKSIRHCNCAYNIENENDILIEEEPLIAESVS